MSTASSNPNYAAIIGIHSLGGAIVFAILFAFLLAFFIRKSFTHPTYVHYVLTFFCVIRVAAFIIRAVLAGSTKAGETLGLVIADEILSQVGYFSLLYSAYTLVLDRTLLSDLQAANHPILRITQAKKLFRLVLTAGVVIGIVAASRTTSAGPSNTSSTKALRITSVAIFLVLTVVQAIQTVVLATSSVSAQSEYYKRGKDSLGIRHGNYILVIISVLLMIRELFLISTVTNVTKQYNEHLFYPLVALPEILVVILFTTPGLVPRRAEIQEYSSANATTKPESYETTTGSRSGAAA